MRERGAEACAARRAEGAGGGDGRRMQHSVFWSRWTLFCGACANGLPPCAWHAPRRARSSPVPAYARGGRAQRRMSPAQARRRVRPADGWPGMPPCAAWRLRAPGHLCRCPAGLPLHALVHAQERARRGRSADAECRLVNSRAQGVFVERGASRASIPLENAPLLARRASMAMADSARQATGEDAPQHSQRAPSAGRGCTDSCGTGSLSAQMTRR